MAERTPDLYLLLDLGSSRLKWSLRDAYGHERARGAEAGIANGVARMLQDAPRVPTDAWLARVGAPERSQRLREALATAWPGLEVREVAPQLVPAPDGTDAEGTFGPESGALRSAYADGQLGVDRYCALLAARARCPGRPVVLVDAGTAVTVDVLRADGVHAGGYILPGLYMARERMQRLLSDRVAPLAPGEGFDPWPVTDPGRNTTEALDRGWATAWAGGVAAVVTQARAAAQTAGPVACRLAGGDAAALRAYLDAPLTDDRGAVLDGLAVLAGLALPETGEGEDTDP